MSAGVMPWAARLAACQNIADLEQLWRECSSAEAMADAIETLDRQGLDYDPVKVQGRMAADWETRAQEIRSQAQDKPSDRQLVSAREKLAELDDQSLQATHDYGSAVQDWATKHATHKKLRAKKFTTLKAEWAGRSEKLTDGFANELCDADEEVAAAYLASEMAEAKMKAAKSLLDHINRSFEHHRSLFVREDRADGGRR